MTAGIVAAQMSPAGGGSTFSIDFEEGVLGDPIPTLAEAAPFWCLECVGAEYADDQVHGGALALGSQESAGTGAPSIYLFQSDAPLDGTFNGGVFPPDATVSAWIWAGGGSYNDVQVGALGVNFSIHIIQYPRTGIGVIDTTPYEPSVAPGDDAHYWVFLLDSTGTPVATVLDETGVDVPAGWVNVWVSHEGGGTWHWKITDATDVVLLEDTQAVPDMAAQDWQLWAVQMTRDDGIPAASFLDDITYTEP